MEVKLGKVDKCFIIAISLAIIFIVLLFVTVSIGISADNFYIEKNKTLSMLLYKLFSFNLFFILPTNLFAIIVTFILKIFAKNKVGKDWAIIVIGLFTIIFLSLFIFMLIASTFNPLY